MNDVTEDFILGGKVLIRQPRHGYRVNVDTLLLAATLPPGQAASVVEAGCGVGGALLAMAKIHKDSGANAHFVGIERDVGMVGLARENVISNDLSESVRIVEGDVLTPPTELGQFDAVLFNPPYDYEGEGRPPAEEKRAAYIADRPITDWIKIWSNRMTSGASLTLIQRPQRLPEILSALEGRLGGAAIFPVRSEPGAPARRIIARAWKGSRAPMQLLAGLDLHPEDRADKYTPETEALLHGEAWIDLG
ncbi:MAG: methyltransferase domain-containing protein [Pseudomonadota bacterium]